MLINCQCVDVLCHYYADVYDGYISHEGVCVTLDRSFYRTIEDTILCQLTYCAVDSRRVPLIHASLTRTSKGVNLRFSYTSTTR